MKFRALSLSLVTALLLSAQPPGQPQPPRNPPPIAWWDNPVANGLDLTEAQKNRVSFILKDSNDRLLQKREAVDHAEHDMDAIFNATAIDRDKARVAIDQLADARRDLTREVSWLMLRMRGVLTYDQWKMLEARRQNPPERGGKGRGRGYRGPGSAPGSGPGFSDTKQ